MRMSKKNAIQVIKWRGFHAWLALKAWLVRRKDRIRFGFLIQELTQWKTESLYREMLKHPRFDPILCISPSRGYPGAENELMDYCRKKGYEFTLLDPAKTIEEQMDVDIVVPEKPYLSEIHGKHQIDMNRHILYVVIPYYLSTITEDWLVNQRHNLLCWRQFVDNNSCRETWAKVHRLKGMNYVVTGLPVMDDLLTPKEDLPDVWPVDDGRKRIIYSPHHTVSDLHMEGIGYSTFLAYCEEMLALRDRYAEKVYFVFKPHPSLRNSLKRLWGEEKTDAYYQRWEKPGYSHVEQGGYLALFKHSDALIHDCGSFTVEYMYMDRPVMYLVRDESHAANMIPYAKEAFDLHYKGKCKEDIEHFILDVIAGNDLLKEKRAAFKQRFLLPPGGRTACENIIRSILGER